MFEKIKEYCNNSLSKDSIRLISETGMINSGLFDYDDTSKFYEQFHIEIWNYITEKTRNNRHENIFAYLSAVRGDTRPDYRYDIWGEQQFKWFLIQIVVDAASYREKKHLRTSYRKNLPPALFAR